MRVKLAVELYQTVVSVTALQNNEMPIGVDHKSIIDNIFIYLALQNNEMPIGVDHWIYLDAAIIELVLQNNEMPIGVDSNLDRSDYQSLR